MSLSDFHLRAARAAIAAAVLDALPEAEIGCIRLRPDQLLTISRAERALRRVGGCLIGEDVGRGKTYVALAIARRWRRPLVLAPAALRSTWHAAAARAGVTCTFASHESLSAGHKPSDGVDGIIVDESHHFRTTATQRYAALTELAAYVPLVLLSATPLQNRVRDLAAQVALFLGERAFTLDGSELSRFAIRGDADVADMPTVAEPEWLSVNVDDSRALDAILALTPAARPLDGGDAGILGTISLVRAWASSRAALLSTLRERRRLATAIEQSIAAGRTPTRREARAWTSSSDAIQLGFSSLLADTAPELSTLGDGAAVARDDLESTQRLIALLRNSIDPDVARIDALRLLRSRFPDSRIVAFSERASTVAALFAGMRSDAGVGMLTAHEAHIASGRIARDELIDRFAPVSRGFRSAGRHEQVTLLLATDVLSEGMNLQDANVVVHLDLPWNPAKLAQRVGRVRRPGGVEVVYSFILAPPADAAVLLDAEARLRRKLNDADVMIGRGFGVLPANLAATRADAAPFSASVAGALVERVSAWRRPERHVARVVVAGVRGPATVWLAALNDGRMICRSRGQLTQSPTLLFEAALACEGEGCAASQCEMDAAVAELAVWLENDHVLAVAGSGMTSGPLRQRAHRWLTGVLHSLPRHQRASAMPLVGRLKQALSGPLSLGAEQALAAFSESRADDVLAQAVRVIDAAEQRCTDEHVGEMPACVVALIVASP